MPRTAKTMDTPTHPSNPGNAGVTCPDGQKKQIKPHCAVQPPEGWEEHMFSYRDRRRSLMPCTSLPSMPSSLSQKEDHIPKEDAEMDIPKKSSDGKEEGDEGKDCDSESNGNDIEDDGPATESSLPLSLPPPPLPSDSSDTKDDLLQLHQPCQTNNKGKGRAIDVKDTDVAGSDGDALPRSNKPGTLSHAALDDIHEFSSKVKKEAEELGMTLARREKLKHIYEWSENSSIAPANKSVKSIATRVQNTKTQFSGLAEAWSNLKEIEIIGMVMWLRDGSSSEAGLLSRSSTAGSGDTKRLEPLSIWKYDKGEVSSGSQGSMW
ncbi:hypothetical protein EDC04DRAFT_2610419 [Pisolithus marmoratus]|nr:hypothetical protein EDC04DRAFT_2610419 [Pisolithus marmoratus]